MVPPTASSSVLVYSASGLGHDLLTACSGEKREPWRLSVYSSHTFSSQCHIAMDTVVQGGGQLLNMPTPFSNCCLNKSGNILFMWEKTTVRMITTISQSPKFKAAIIIDVLPCLIL